jgi:2'-5' RNA ligase superfamily
MADAPSQAWGDSALVVPIPEAEPVVGRLRLEHDVVAARGVPAHVTVLFPFVPTPRIDASVHARLRALFGTLPGFDYRFERVGRFGATTVYLAPEPARAFSALTDAVAACWPEHPPYGGAHAEVIPHLTVGDQLPDGVADHLVGEVRRALARHGPVTGTASEISLMTEDASARWSVSERYPLAAQGSRA